MIELIQVQSIWNAVNAVFCFSLIYLWGLPPFHGWKGNRYRSINQSIDQSIPFCLERSYTTDPLLVYNLKPPYTRNMLFKRFFLYQTPHRPVGAATSKHVSHLADVGFLHIISQFWFLNSCDSLLAIEYHGFFLI